FCHGLAGIQMFEKWPLPNARFFDEHSEGLMETSRSEFQAAGGRLAVADIAPQTDPRIIRRFPDISNEQSLARSSCGDPTKVAFDDVADHVRVRVGGEATHIDRLRVLVEGLWPEERRLLRRRQGASLGEAAAPVAVDEGGRVEKRRSNGRILHGVKDAAERILIGDFF